MSIQSQADLRGLQAIGRIVRAALGEMTSAVRPGVTTAEVDAAGAAVLRRDGAESSPPKIYGFPGTACISVNDEALHGIPGGRTVREGDLVKLDMTAGKDGFVADSAVTVRVGKVSEAVESLARAGIRVNEIGRAVEQEVRDSGFRLLREYCGHGVGRTIHEEPCVPNFHDPRMRTWLTEGLVITVEPIISRRQRSAGNGRSHMTA